MSNEFSDRVHKTYVDTISKYDTPHKHIEGMVAEISKNRDKSRAKSPLTVENIELGRDATELAHDDNER